MSMLPSSPVAPHDHLELGVQGLVSRDPLLAPPDVVLGPTPSIFNVLRVSSGMEKTTHERYLLYFGI